MSMKFLWMGFAVSSIAMAWIGCGGSKSGDTSTTGTGGSGSTNSSSGTGATGTTSSGTGTGGTGTGGTGSGGPGDLFECTVPSTSPSAGSCVSVVAQNDAGTGAECNPVTNEGCASGQSCDYNLDDSGNVIGFVCFDGQNDLMVCATCGDPNATSYCAPGTTCFQYDDSGDAACTHYCCSDADCGSGKCTTMAQGGSLFGDVAPNLGICTTM